MGDLPAFSLRVLVAALLLVPVAVAFATSQISGNGWSFQSEQRIAEYYSSTTIHTIPTTIETQTLPSTTQTEEPSTHTITIPTPIETQTLPYMTQTEEPSTTVTCVGFTTTTTRTITGTLTWTYTSVLTRTVSAVITNTQTQASPILNIPGFPPEGIAIGLAIALALFAVRRRR